MIIFHLPGNAYRECMENGTWAFKSNYSSCEPILEEKVFFRHILSCPVVDFGPKFTKMHHSTHRSLTFLFPSLIALNILLVYDIKIIFSIFIQRSAFANNGKLLPKKSHTEYTFGCLCQVPKAVKDRVFRKWHRMQFPTHLSKRIDQTSGKTL